MSRLSIPTEPKVVTVAGAHDLGDLIEKRANSDRTITETLVHARWISCNYTVCIRRHISQNTYA